MAATITALTYSDFPQTLVSGADKKRIMVHFVTTAASTGSTINLATHIPGITDIEGIVYVTDDNVKSGTASVWSTTTLTVHASYEGVPEFGLICTTSET